MCINVECFALIAVYTRAHCTALFASSHSYEYLRAAEHPLRVLPEGTIICFTVQYHRVTTPHSRSRLTPATQTESLVTRGVGGAVRHWLHASVSNSTVS